MNERPPLRAFLERVHQQRVVRLGPRDYLDVEKLIRSRKDWPPAELRVALASVLARSSEQWNRIVAVYDEMAADAGWVSEAREPRAPSRGEDADRVEPILHWVEKKPPGLGERLLGWFLERRNRLLDRLRNASRLGWAVGVGAVAVVPVLLLGFWLVKSQEVKVALDAPPSPPKSIEWQTEEQDGVVLRRLPDFDQDLDSESWQQPPDLEPEILLGLAVLSAATLLLGLSWLRLPAAYRKRQALLREEQQRRTDETRRELQKRRAAEGKALGVRYHVQVYLPVSQQAMLDSAELLGRIFGESPGFDLDTEATLDRTLAAGGRFDPVLEPRALRHDVVVLIDREEGDHPWLGSFLRLLDAWGAQGITLRRFTFQGSPEKVDDAETNQEALLGDLARQLQDLPLILFSRRLEPMAFAKPATWPAVLTAWKHRAWLDPDPRPTGALDRSRKRSVWELQQQGLHRFRLTDQGLVRLARGLAGDGAGPRRMIQESPWPELPESGEKSRLAEGLRLWALVAALVPDPTWDQLEAIRRHFEEIHRVLPEPWSLQLLLQWMEREIREIGEARSSVELEGGIGLAIPERLQDVWLREQRRIEKADAVQAGFEARARRLLLDQLGPNPPDDPMDAETWRFKRAKHQAMLEPHKAARLLDWVGDSPLRHEALRWLRAELGRRDSGDGEVLPVRDREVLGRLVGEGGKIPLKALGPGLRSHWRVVGVVGVWVALLWGGLKDQEFLRTFGQEVRDVSIERPPVFEVFELQEQPEMITLQGGSFQMGGTEYSDEQPKHTVAVPAFQISRTEVTVAQYRACLQAGSCDAPQASYGSCNWGVEGRDDHPMNCVSWTEARKYAEWIGARLPTEAEWEFAARSGGQEREYPWNDREATCELAVIADCGSDTQPVCSRPAGNTEQGLCDMAGNVWEWVEDDWHSNYQGAPADGTAWIGSPRSSLRVLRGGSWGYGPRDARVACRGRVGPSVRDDALGFRVARSLSSAL